MAKKQVPLNRPKPQARGGSGIDPAAYAELISKPALGEPEEKGRRAEALGGEGKRSTSTSTVHPHKKAAQSWEATHKRVTFHCPLDVLEALEAAVASGDRSKSRVIVDALREHLSER